MTEFSSRARCFNRRPVSEFSSDLPPGTMNLSSGSPALGLMPIDDFQTAMTRVLQDKKYLSFQYGPAQGCTELLEWLAQYHGVEVNQVMITSGSQQSIDLISKVFIDQRDPVLVETPAYSGALDVFSWVQADITPMPDVAEIPDGVFKIAYVEPSYQNPTGRCWTLDQRKSFMSEAQKRDILVVEDAAYADIFFDETSTPLRDIDATRVIYLGSFSKILNPGIRLSYVIAEPKIINKLVEAKKITDMASSYFLQSVTAEMLHKIDINVHLSKLRKSYHRKRDFLVDALSRHCPELKFPVPTGGIFLWAHSTISSLSLRDRALAEGVSIVPGREFYVQDPDLFSIRMSYSRITEEEANAAAIALCRSISG
jgi:2-aminoadipate transaminase